MRLVPLGVRGSTGAPGAQFVRFGGHTSCVAVYADSDTDVPRLILDAGSGLQQLAGLLGDASFAGDIVLTHLHWDHVHGLPFCPPIDRPDSRVRLFVPVEPGGDPMAALRHGFSPPSFPIGPDGLKGEWSFHPLTEGAAGPAVRALPIAHKGGWTVGLRIELDGATAAYLPDHALHGAAGPSEEALRLADGVDVLLHDGQYRPEEAAVAVEYGHATIDAVLAFADRCKVGELVLTHHAPTRTDDELAALAERYRRTPHGCPVRFARQLEAIAVAAQVVRLA